VSGRARQALKHFATQLPLIGPGFSGKFLFAHVVDGSGNSAAAYLPMELIPACSDSRREQTLRTLILA